MWNVDLAQMALMKFAVPSLVRTMEKEKYEYELYVGVDDDDKFWTDAKKQEEVQAAAGEDLKVRFGAFGNKPNRVPFNQILSLAAAGGADYIVRINDDSEFVTQGWTTLGIATLAAYDPPNVGVVGPTCKQGNVNILTHDMVHRTHMEIFQHKYYPPVFDNWWVDDWITNVYGKNRTTKLKSWQVNHHTTHHRTRYHVNYALGKKLKAELDKGKAMLKKYLDSRFCKLQPGVAFRSTTGLDKALINKAYGHKDRLKCNGVIVEISDTRGSAFTTSAFFEEALQWKSLLVAPDAKQRIRNSRPNAATVNARLGKATMLWSSSMTFKELFEERSIKHVDVLMLNSKNIEETLEVMDWSIKVDFWVVNVDGHTQETQQKVSKLLNDHGYLSSGWDMSKWCSADKCQNNVVFLRPAMTVVVLTMNRAKSLSRLLKSLEEAEYRGDPIALNIKIDKSPDNHEAIGVAKAFNFSHGPKNIEVSKQNKGLALSWFEAWTPTDDSALGIILEDDVEVSPMWYRWVKGAWGAYIHRKDVGGVTLQRQLLIPSRPPKLREIVNNHEPFLYSLLGSIGFSPHPARWLEFTSWIRSIDFRTHDVATPELITSHWWKHGNRKHMWTQHFVYFSKKYDLSTLYINLPGGVTLGTHWREKGKHHGSNLGPDYPVAKTADVEVFPKEVVKYGFDGRPRAQAPESSCLDAHKHITDNNSGEWNGIPGHRLLWHAALGEVLCKLLDKNSNVLEWGPSALTLFFGKYSKTWDSVEYNKKNLNRIKQQVDMLPSVNTYFTKHTWNGTGDGTYAEFNMYVDKPKTFNKSYDIVVVNGRARVDCVRSLVRNNLLTPSAHILMFDWERKPYKAVLDTFEVENVLDKMRPQVAVLRRKKLEPVVRRKQNQVSKWLRSKYVTSAKRKALLASILK